MDSNLHTIPIVRFRSEDFLFEIRKVNVSVKLLRSSFLSCLWTRVEIAQTDIIPESADQFKAQCIKALSKGRFREECVSNDDVTQLEQLISKVIKRL